MAKNKAWDSTLKRLVHINPEAFVHWLLPEAEFIEEHPTEVESLKREVDALLTVMVRRKRMLLHIEFQTYNDSKMTDRLLLYNVLTRNAYKLPVLSCVVYLLRDGTVTQSPFRITIPTGYMTHEFHFESIEIGQLTPEDLLNLGSVPLTALVPLTRDGTNQEVILRMFAELKKQRETGQAGTQATEVEVIAFTLTSFVLQHMKKTADLDWLIRRFREMHDIMHDTPIFQEILREGLEQGLEQGLEKGLEQGLEKGKLEATRHILLILTERRFPALTSLAQEQAARIQDLNVLDDVIVNIGLAQTERDGYVALRRWDKTFDA